MSNSVCLTIALTSSLSLILAWTASGTHAGANRSKTAAVAGINTTQARFGTRRPNSAATSRSATFRAASAINARPAGVSRKSVGNEKAELTRSFK